ncbi:MAG: DUF1501 domain-containing protein, partial [Akkermansiaceae bacterium]
MNSLADYNAAISRRQFFRKNGTGLGMASLASLLPSSLNALSNTAIPSELQKIAPKAKRVVYLSMLGAPSQLDLFDYKPKLKDRFAEDLGPYLKEQGQRLTGMTSGQAKFPLAPSIFKFKQHGKSGAWISELLPHTAKMADDITIIKSMHTEAINHDPAHTFMNTGSMISGRPAAGSWLWYGLGNDAQDLPGFVVMVSTGNYGQKQPIASRQWHSGLLPSRFQGVSFRSQGD